MSEIDESLDCFVGCLFVVEHNPDLMGLEVILKCCDVVALGSVSQAYIVAFGAKRTLFDAGAECIGSESPDAEIGLRRLTAPIYEFMS